MKYKKNYARLFQTNVIEQEKWLLRIKLIVRDAIQDITETVYTHRSLEELKDDIIKYEYAPQ